MRIFGLALKFYSIGSGFVFSRIEDLFNRKNLVESLAVCLKHCVKLLLPQRLFSEMFQTLA